ncbi:MAG: response regulator [Bacteroidales bacterium]|nr:response regulator [Bacteroidales bacterium]
MKKILVIEDAISVRKILETVLGKENHVHSTEDGSQALEWLQDGNMADLIICDIQMPVMSGEEFVQEIKSTGIFSNIPIIMLSGIESSEERIKMLKLGANDYLVKPFNPEELKLKVGIFLK